MVLRINLFEGYVIAKGLGHLLAANGDKAVMNPIAAKGLPVRASACAISFS